MLRCWQRILLENSTFSLTVWLQAQLFIMLHVSFELGFVCILQLIPGDWLYQPRNYHSLCSSSLLTFFVSHSVC
jgi:hypothetical protein